MLRAPCRDSSGLGIMPFASIVTGLLLGLITDSDERSCAERTCGSNAVYPKIDPNGLTVWASRRVVWCEDPHVARNCSSINTAVVHLQKLFRQGSPDLKPPGCAFGEHVCARTSHRGAPQIALAPGAGIPTQSGTRWIECERSSENV